MTPRPIRTIVYTPHFARAYRNLSNAIKKIAEKREIIFRNNAFDPRLRTHKLKGRLGDYWSFSVTHSYRIVFTFEGDNQVAFHDAGDHRVYQ